MRIFLKLAAACSVLIAAPSIGGEVTGKGQPTPLQGESWCRYSGLNDTPYQDGMGQTQSYGQLRRLYPDLINPQDFNPATSYPESCNPTREGEPPPGSDFPPSNG